MFRTTRVAVALAICAATFSFSATTAEATGPSVYVVVSGDSLYGISKKIGVDLTALLDANSMTLHSVILPGQKLVVPGGGSGGGSTGATATGGTYTVKTGDSLGRIATKHGVSLAALLEVNGMTAKSLILPGQTINLPAGATGGSGGGSGGGGAAPAAGGTYTVKAGDSLGRIATKYGVSLAALLEVNGMTAKSLILPGQTISLPTGAAAPDGGGSGGGSGGAPAVGGTYTIKAGDSLGRIAIKAGVSLGSLLAVNGMTAKSLILPGQTINLPAGAASPEGGGGAQTPGAGVQAVIDFALAQQGKPYQFAASGPDAYDCSGLTRRAYLQVGINLIHQSASQALQGTPVAFTTQPILPGDLVFLATRGNDVISHVGIALSDSTWIQARRPGDVVRVGPMPARSSIVAVRRLIPAA